MARESGVRHVMPSGAEKAAKDVVGKYRLIAELGSGGMANVYLAVAAGPGRFNKLAVVKLLRPAMEADHDFVTMFLDEARLAARLNHPNVVQTYEGSDETGRYMIVMEYLEGQPLSAILQRARKGAVFLLAQHLRVIVEALNGLHHAHELTDFDGTSLQLVHRDMSPHNVFVTFDGSVKVLDFGIAKAATSSAETRAGVLKGKIGYMAPEQMSGEPLDRRADIFSVGVMLWEAVTGARMWKGQPDVVVMHKVLSGEIPTPESVTPDVPAELSRICMKALADAPAKRYATALELQADLEAYLSSTGDRTSVRDVGRVVTELFADIRAETKALIEAQLARPQSMSTGEFPAIPLPTVSTVSLQTGSSASGRQRVGGSSPTGLPSLNGESRWTGSGVNVTAASSSSKPSGSIAGLTVAACVLLAGAMIVAAILVTSKRTAPIESAAGQEAALGPPSAVASAEDTRPPHAGISAPASEIDVRLSVTPAEARLFLDGAPVEANPSTRRMLRDGAEHHVRAEAVGYATKTVDVRFDRDVSVVLSLERERPAARPPTRPATAPRSVAVSPPPVAVAATPAPPPAPPPATTQPEAPTPTKSGKPNRKLDSKNPWD